MKTNKSVTVEMDDALRIACAPFDYAFNGTSIFETPDFNAPVRDGSWGIGLIVGPSGSGKSTLLEANYGAPSPVSWDASKAIASQVSYDRLGAVGLNSVPSWCRPFHVLSTGEAFRATMAASLRSNASFDEFTSVVDRNVAKSCCHSIQRHIRQSGMTGVVFATCHSDVIEWLAPDWIFDTQTGILSRGRSLRRREPIVLEVVASSCEWWPIFRPHHYLSHDINKSARCFLATWEGKPVAFSASLAFPNRNFANAWRGHRTVVLPDFQGLGIGVRLSDFVAADFVSRGCRYFSKTAHPRMGEYRNRSALWKPTTKNGRARKDYSEEWGGKEAKHLMRHRERLCYSHEFIGVKP